MGGTTSLAKGDDLQEPIDEGKKRNVPALPLMLGWSSKKDNNIIKMNNEQFKFNLTQSSEKDISHFRSYGVIPLNVVHSVMGFQQPSDLFSMILTCKLFEHVCNNQYFWESYFKNYKNYFFQRKKVEVDDENKNWKRLFFENYYMSDDQFYRRKYRIVKLDKPSRFSFKIVLVGMDGGGKSTFVRRLIDNTYSEENTSENDHFKPGMHTSSISYEYETKERKKETITLNIFDKNTDPLDRYRCTHPDYFYRGYSGVLVFFGIDSLVDNSSNDNNEQNYYKTRSWIKEMIRNGNDGSIILVVGSKLDLHEENSTKENKSKDREWLHRMKDYIKDQNDWNPLSVIYVELSSKDGRNIHKCMGILIDSVIRRRRIFGSPDDVGGFVDKFEK